ncbi:MAG: hypothetical protein ACR5K9_06125 [Wolbachia sp.]
MFRRNATTEYLRYLRSVTTQKLLSESRLCKRSIKISYSMLGAAETDSIVVVKSSHCLGTQALRGENLFCPRR